MKSGWSLLVAFPFVSLPVYCFQVPLIVQAKSNLNSSLELATIADMTEWDVDRYQQQHSFVYQYGASLLDLVRPMKGERILDIGCGTGELTHQLFTAASADGEEDTTWVLGVDADVHMIRKAHEQFASSQVQFVHADVCTMDQDPILSESPPFDVLFSNAALHWIPQEKMDRAVQNMAQLLKPGTGRFVMEFGGHGNVEAIVGACADVLREQYDVHQIPKPWYFPSVSEFTTTLERHGLEVQTAELYDRPTVLSDPVNGMKNWIQMFGASYAQAAIAACKSTDSHLDEDDDDESIHNQQDLFSAVVQERLRPLLFDGTQWTADYRRIRVTGRRCTE